MSIIFLVVFFSKPFFSKVPSLKKAKKRRTTTTKPMDNVKLDQLNWTAIGFLTQTTLLVLALIDVDLVRFLIFRLGLLLVLVGAGFFFLVKNGRRSRLWLAGLLLKH